MTTSPLFPVSSPDLLLSPHDTIGLGEFYGSAFSPQALDAEFLSRVDPAKLKGLSDLTETAWYGYRFAHPGHRILLFLHQYRVAYERQKRYMGKRYMRPEWMQDAPLSAMRPSVLTSIITATLTADIHGVPYEFYIGVMMDLHLRETVAAPLKPAHLYLKSRVITVMDKWKERNESGIYTAASPLLHASRYEGHRFQDAYMDYLCEAVRNKGNKPFYLARLMFDVGHLTPEHAATAFGIDAVARAEDHK